MIIGLLLPVQVVMKNTIEAFKAEDKNAFIHRQGEALWAWIQSGAFWRDPGYLSRFSVLLFGDLKKYVFYYWFAFPAFNVPPSIRVVRSVKLSEEYDDSLVQDIVTEFRNEALSSVLLKLLIKFT
jgi:ubiquitin-like modifier-activating enzyme ATG7